MEKTKFNILDRVYHITPESRIGIVIDIRYTFSSKLFEYEVTFSSESNSLWYFDYELQTSKSYE